MPVFRTQIENDILNVIEKSLATLGYSVVRIRIIQSKKSKIMQIMLENINNTPITIDDCRKASRQISVLLDLHDPLSDKYNLEVSSAGINRPLTRVEDFARYTKHKVKISLSEPIDDRRKFVGIITEATDNVVFLELSDDVGNILEIPISKILDAHLEPEILNNSKSNVRKKNAAK